ncbi:MAG: hypothetical protein ACR2OX_06750 [Methyloligellaceae bacterium]
MTRKKLQQTLVTLTAAVGVILVLAAVARLSGSPQFKAVYDFIHDMSLLIATVAAAYLASVFQRRQNFLQSLREQWRDIVTTKSALIAFCDNPVPTSLDYLQTRAQLSCTIDHMRIVYANVGETEDLIGRYPFEPLHDMRKALERLDTRQGQPLGLHDRAVVRDAIWEAFNTLREHFLDEFDLEEPTRPILTPGSRRTKRPGARIRNPELESDVLSHSAPQRAP